MRELDRAGVQKLMADGAQVIEALPASEYAEDHLPGAINMPLRTIETDAANVLDRSKPVIVYCWDSA